MDVFVDNCNDPECLFDFAIANLDCVGKTSKCVNCGKRFKWEEASGFNSDGDEIIYILGKQTSENEN